MPSNKELRFALCSCGKPVFEDLGFCLPCLQAQSKQYQRSTLPMRPAKQLTPPPSQPGSPRRTAEVPARTSRASEVITQAFAQEGSDAHLFPASLYRMPARSTSRTSSESSSRRPSDSPSRPSSRTLAPSTESTSSRTSRSTTPEIRSSDYAPMAAGFARLSMKEVVPPRRSESARPSFDLEARMFSGPA